VEKDHFEILLEDILEKLDVILKGAMSRKLDAYAARTAVRTGDRSLS
jgi:hypothetical protein